MPSSAPAANTGRRPSRVIAQATGDSNSKVARYCAASGKVAQSGPASLLPTQAEADSVRLTTVIASA